MANNLDSSASSSSSLSLNARLLILGIAFLGWMCAGVQLSITSLAMRSAAIDLLSRTDKIDLDRFNELNKIQADAISQKTEPAFSATDKQQLTHWKELAAQWFGWYQCALLFGAAAGGFVFGRLGDRIGRSKAMAASILCYSLMSGATYFVQSPLQLLILRFITCMGVGGMWPNGVTLVSEAWSKVSRPMVAGIIGTAANIGIFIMFSIAAVVPVTPGDWRWVVLVGAIPAIIGIISLLTVPESPRWLATRNETASESAKPATTEVFQSPLLRVTLIGILLATIPLFGAWGSSNWMMPWAEEAGETANPPNPHLKAHVGQARSFTGVVGSLLGGWIGSLFGRRRAYMLISFAALFCAQYAFWFTVPTDGDFLIWVAALGFFSGIYFGWLPLFLPELFPTRVRSTGAGVSFNFGRILTAVTIFVTAPLMQAFEGDFARIGRVTSLVYAIGIFIIWFAPDTTRSNLED